MNETHDFSRLTPKHSALCTLRQEIKEPLPCDVDGLCYLDDISFFGLQTLKHKQYEPDAIVNNGRTDKKTAADRLGLKPFLSCYWFGTLSGITLEAVSVLKSFLQN